MKTHFFTARSLTMALPAACCALSMSRAGAQPVDRTRPPAIIPPIVQAPVAEVAAVGAKAPGGNVAVVGAKVPDAEVAVVGLSASAAKMPILVEKLRAYTIVPQQAWEAGDLDVTDLIYFLESLDRWGGFTWDKDPDLRRQMVALLVQHGQDQLQHTEKLSPAVRLWLADYYGSVNDSKCLTLCESILREQKEPKKGEDALVFQVLERMAWFYRDQGQYEKSAENWLQVPTLIPDQGWWQADSLIEAARAYSNAKKLDKAQRLYAQVIHIGDTAEKGLVIYDQALTLIKENHHTEARVLLQQHLGDDEGAWVKVGLLSLLSASYLRTGEVEGAHHTAQNALDFYYTLKDPPQDGGMKHQVERAKEVLAWCQQYEKNKTLVNPKD